MSTRIKNGSACHICMVTCPFFYLSSCEGQLGCCFWDQFSTYSIAAADTFSRHYVVMWISSNPWNSMEEKYHEDDFFYIYRIFEMDVVSPWEYLHAGVAAARLSLSVNRLFFKTA